MSRVREMLTTSADEVIAESEAKGCGLETARRMVHRRKLLEAILHAENIEDVRALLDRIVRLTL